MVDHWEGSHGDNDQEKRKESVKYAGTCITFPIYTATSYAGMYFLSSVASSIVYIINHSSGEGTLTQPPEFFSMGWALPTSIAIAALLTIYFVHKAKELIDEE